LGSRGSQASIADSDEWRARESFQLQFQANDGVPVPVVGEDGEIFFVTEEDIEPRERGGEIVRLDVASEKHSVIVR
jgi:hypothetical protein